LASVFGCVVCGRVLELRHHDGSNQLGDLAPGAYSDYTSYSPVNSPQRISNTSRWQPLLVGGVLQVWQLAFWNRVTAFGLTSAAQFRPLLVSPGPVQPGSSEFVRQTRALVELSASLGDREKVIAEFWADGSGTATPPGHWNAIAQFVSHRDGHSTADDVEMFYILDNALLDTSIAAWDAKRSWDSVRPVTAIRFLVGSARIAVWAGPGLGTQIMDCKDFRSYLPTPAFPGYVSGHSAFSAAGAEILKRWTGSDRFGDTYIAPPGSSLIERGLTPTQEVALTWSTFTAAAEEAGMSRRYGGIHFESDDRAGQALGRAVAAAVWAKATGLGNAAR
jgi:membrane-associated phospholipid phosphatase